MQDSMLGQARPSGSDNARAQGPLQAAQTASQYQPGTAPPFAAPAAPPPTRWARIPAALRERAQWVLAGADKRPLTADGRPASVTDPSTWTDFDTACRVAVDHGLDIGYVLTADDPFTCIDLDVKDDTSREQMQRFQSIVNSFSSYSEISRGGRGMHIWVRGKIGAGCKRDGAEVYSQERFIVCTGNVHLNLPIEDRGAMLTSMASQMRGPEHPAAAFADAPEVESDDVVIERAMNAVNAEKFISLARGEWQGKPAYPTQSEADLALMSILAFYSPNDAQCRRIFRRTELGKREKAVKDDRYLDRTLKRVRLSDRRKQAAAHGRQVAETVIAAWQRASPTSATAGFPGFKFRFAKAGDTAARSEYLFDPWLPFGTVVGCYGRGEAGKSSWAATGCASVSSFVSTLWITSEEPESHVRTRHIGCGGQERTLAVSIATPTKIDPKTNKPAATSFNVYEHLEPAIEAFKRDPETRSDRPLGVVVLDAIVALVTWGKGESPNDDAAVKRLIAFLLGIAERQRLTILILGHLNKRKPDQLADAVTGSAAWTNSLRLAYMFVKDEEVEFQGFVRTVKSNTGTPFGATYRTRPVHTLRTRPDGKNDVLCGVEMDAPLYGELALREAVATEDDPYFNRLEQKRAKVQAIIDRTLRLLQSGPTTRKAVETMVGDKVSRRHWQEADKILYEQHGVQMANTDHNTRIYSFRSPS